MLKTAGVLASAALAALICTSASAANLLNNGSFEDTSYFAPNSDDTMRLATGSTALSGWNVYSNEIAWIGPSNPFGFYADDGSYSLDLQSYSDGSPYGGVSQSLTTVSGRRYLLSFDLGAYFGTSQIQATSGSTSGVFTAVDPEGFGWTSESLAFTATSSTTLISLLGVQDSTTYIGLDNVSVTCTASCSAFPVSGAPEPHAWALLLLGIGGMGYTLRRAKTEPASANTT